jgi:dCMP deaminase
MDKRPSLVINESSISPDVDIEIKNGTSWDDIYLDMAHLIARKSTCRKYQVGAILVKNNNILAMGYNGVHCDNLSNFKCMDEFTAEDMTTEEGRTKHRKWSETNEIHAECRALLDAMCQQTWQSNSTLYTTLSPCAHCAKFLLVAGVERIVYSKVYNKDIINFLATKGVIIYQL